MVAGAGGWMVTFHGQLREDRKGSLLIKSQECISFIKAPPPKGSTALQNSTTSWWGPDVGTHEPVRDVSHSNCNTDPFVHVWNDTVWTDTWQININDI